MSLSFLAVDLSSLLSFFSGFFSSGFFFGFSNERATSSNVETCKNLYTIAKNWHNEVSFIEIVSYKSSTEHREGFLYGDYECSTDSSKKCLSTATVKDIDNACRVFKKDNNNYSILFVFWDAE